MPKVIEPTPWSFTIEFDENKAKRNGYDIETLYDTRTGTSLGTDVSASLKGLGRRLTAMRSSRSASRCHCCPEPDGSCVISSP